MQMSVRVGARESNGAGSAGHELVNPGHWPLGITLFVPRDRPALPPSHPQNLSAPLEVSRQKLVPPKSKASLWGMCQNVLVGSIQERPLLREGPWDLERWKDSLTPHGPGCVLL